jgi:hypothetical protein
MGQTAGEERLGGGLDDYRFADTWRPHARSVASRCSICSHPQQRAIERALAKGAAVLDVCEEFVIKRVVLEKHVENCPKVFRGARRAGAKSEPEQAPESSSHPAVARSPLRAIGSHTEEIYRSLENLIRASEAEDVTPAQRAALEGRKLSLLREIRQREAGRSIHEHPDFAGLVEDLVAAVVGALGPSAPEGLEGRIADRLEELQAERVETASAAPKQRAA